MNKEIPESLIPFYQDAVSNGNQREQANIRKWWREKHGAKGTLVWEYRIEGRFIDAVWFPHSGADSKEEPGLNHSDNHPLKGQDVILLEAKLTLNPELVGQALVYKYFASQAGANVRQVYAFCEKADPSMLEAAKAYDINTVLLDETPV